ncbi:methyltransferase domain-containing protein [Bacillus tianshenii]|uniref:class I SAM-dependent methyltransferase n=1 Tax=Sutcliffiella tianshenii TaxID=1463404 RepID=UPI001CD229B2|nr:class I SAM-dependent methyltransferase [Bacillus tianshenii]MCA1319530.1 methyltransferase domain-containing protein [Bacillus tianshenii]
MKKSYYTDLLALLGIGGAHPGGIELTKDIMMQFDIKDKKFLEVGCGTGQTSAYLHDRGALLTTMDAHSLMVEKANARFIEMGLACRAMLGNIEKSDFTSNTFDFILAESVLSFTDTLSSLKEIHRLLNFGGTFMGIEMVKKNTLPEVIENRMKEFYGLSNIYSFDGWKHVLQESGFTSISLKSIPLDDLEPVEPDFNPSSDIEEKFFQVMQEHEELTSMSRPYIELCVISCTK